MNKYLLTSISIAVGLLLLTGCGKKQWPTADAREETFRWENVNSTKKKDCLYISASIKGNIENLNKIVLLLEGSNKTCPDCPFRPTKIVPVYTAYSRYNKKSNFYFEYCDLKRDKSYRFRLKGINRYDTIESAKTGVRVLGF